MCQHRNQVQASELKEKKNRPINKKLQKKFDECDKEKQYELYLIMRGNFKI